MACKSKTNNCDENPINNDSKTDNSNTEDMLSSGKIAEALKISPAKLKKYISELGIEPAMKKGVCSFYSKQDIDRIKAKL